MPRVIEENTREAGTVESGAVSSTFQRTPIVDGKPQWGARGTTIKLTVRPDATTELDALLTFDLEIQGTEDPAGVGPWYTLVKATGCPPVAIDRALLTRRHNHLKFRSTDRQPAFVRAVAVPNKRCRFAVDIDVE